MRAGRRVRGEIPPAERPHPLWSASLIAAAVGVTALYLWIGARAEGNQRPDAAYYLGVARHIAETGRLEEPLVWHFLDPPPSVIHAPFDYWAPLTSLALVPSLQVFGSGDRVAFTTMALISALSVIAFASLVETSGAIRSAPLRLVALALFALSPAVASYRFDTESIPLFHLITVVALIAFARERHALAVGIASLLLWCRAGDGVVFCALLWLACCARILQRPPGSRRRALRRAGLAAAAAVAAYASFNWSLFAWPVPPAARLGPFLADPLDLLRLGAAAHAATGSPWSWLSPVQLMRALYQTSHGLTEVRLVPFQLGWLLLAAVPGLDLLRRRIATDGLAALLLFVGSTLTVLASRAVHSERTTLVLLPLLVFAGACGADRLLARLAAVLAARSGPRMGAAVPGAVLGLAALGFAASLDVYGARGPAWLGTPSLATLAGTLGDGIVATELPYFVVSEAGQPAVTLPLDGEAAIDTVLGRYAVDWLVLFGTDFAEPDLPTEGLVREILGGRRSHLGSFRLIRTRTEPAWTLFRLERT